MKRFANRYTYGVALLFSLGCLAAAPAAAHQAPRGKNGGLVQVKASCVRADLERAQEIDRLRTENLRLQALIKKREAQLQEIRTELQKALADNLSASWGDGYVPFIINP